MQVCLSLLYEHAQAARSQRSRFTLHPAHVHEFLGWPHLLEQWTVLLTSAGIDVTDSDLLHSSCTQLVFELNAMLLDTKDRECGTTPDEQLVAGQVPPPCPVALDTLAVIRHCGAWAVYKVGEFAAHYICDHFFSRNKDTRLKVDHYVAVRKMLDGFTVRARGACTTKYPTTLETTDRVNRGALTYISDELFGFFVSLEQACMTVWELCYGASPKGHPGTCASGTRQ